MMHAYSSGKSRCKHSGKGLCQVISTSQRNSPALGFPYDVMWGYSFSPFQAAAQEVQVFPDVNNIITVATSWAVQSSLVENGVYGKNYTGSLCLAIPLLSAAILNPYSSLAASWPSLSFLVENVTSVRPLLASPSSSSGG